MKTKYEGTIGTGPSGASKQALTLLTNSYPFYFMTNLCALVPPLQLVLSARLRVRPSNRTELSTLFGRMLKSWINASLSWLSKQMCFTFELILSDKQGQAARLHWQRDIQSDSSWCSVKISIIVTGFERWVSKGFHFANYVSYLATYTSTNIHHNFKAVTYIHV